MPELVTFGETMLRLSPPRGDRIETATELDFRAAGAESNVAVAASRLGVDACWASKLPNSPLGRRCLRELGAHGVDADIVWSDDGRMGTYYIEQGGSPRGTSVVYDRAETAIQTARPEEFPDLFTEAEAFYTSGITPALSDQLADTVSSLLSRARNRGLTTLLDVNYRSKLWTPSEAAGTLSPLLPLVDICIIAERDARTVFGEDGSVEEIAHDMYERADHEVLIITRGDEGALACDADGIHEQAVYESDTLDPVGTGDAFVGGFLAWYLDDAETQTALDAGAATAALKRTLDGDLAILTRDEVERLREGTNGGITR
jgi:2-dehydro-3-deoxygluconokinase